VDTAWWSGSAEVKPFQASELGEDNLRHKLNDYASLTTVKPPAAMWMPRWPLAWIVMAVLTSSMMSRSVIAGGEAA
jgi:hypothetical protein